MRRDTIYTRTIWQKVKPHFVRITTRIVLQEKISLDEKIAMCGCPLQTFDETFQTALNFLGNPQKLWVLGDIEHKRTLLKL